MITLSGFTLSNYYNKVKMVLLEKGVAVRRISVAHSSAASAAEGRAAGGGANPGLVSAT